MKSKEKNVISFLLNNILLRGVLSLIVIIIYSSMLYSEEMRLKPVYIYVDEFAEDQKSLVIKDLRDGVLSREKDNLYNQVDCGFLKLDEIDREMKDLEELFNDIKPYLNIEYESVSSPCFSFNKKDDRILLGEVYTEDGQTLDLIYPSRILKHLRFQICLNGIFLTHQNVATYGYHQYNIALISYGFESSYQEDDLDIILKSCRINSVLYCYPTITSVPLERITKCESDDYRYEERVSYKSKPMSEILRRFMEHIDKNSFLNLEEDIKKLDHRYYGPI